MISVEKTSRILNHFNISFSEGAVLGKRNSKYSYSVDKDSLVKFLLVQGTIKEEIIDVLPTL